MSFTPRFLMPLAAMTLVASCSIGEEAGDSFDPPVRIESVDLGPSPYFDDPAIRSELRCYYYSQVMIKELNSAGPAADRLSMLDTRQGSPDCEPSHELEERVIESSEWQGWFKGVKDALVFFDAPDVFNRHSPFAVFDSTISEKIFEDIAYGEETSSSDYRTSRLQVIPADGGYLLRYMRVVDAGCNLNLEGHRCWERIAAEFSLPDNDLPVCTGYDFIGELVGTDDVESVVAYPVQTSLSDRPRMEPIAGSARCWPAQ